MPLPMDKVPMLKIGKVRVIPIQKDNIFNPTYNICIELSIFSIQNSITFQNQGKKLQDSWQSNAPNPKMYLQEQQTP